MHRVLAAELRIIEGGDDGPRHAGGANGEEGKQQNGDLNSTAAHLVPCRAKQYENRKDGNNAEGLGGLPPEAAVGTIFLKDTPLVVGNTAWRMPAPQGIAFRGIRTIDQDLQRDSTAHEHKSNEGRNKQKSGTDVLGVLLLPEVSLAAHDACNGSSIDFKRLVSVECLRESLFCSETSRRVIHGKR